MRDAIHAFGLCTAIVTALMSVPAPARAQESMEQLLSQLNDYPHAVSVAFSEADVVDHELGLGTLKKVRGVWQFKHSERHSGHLTGYTWQIVDGFTSVEVMEELVSRLGQAELLFACQGRACGSGAQWANRIFKQRILYGREDLQQYRVYQAVDTTYRLVIYSAARSADRQYLHVELLRIGD